jgi:predicted nucleic acid-binding protein
VNGCVRVLSNPAYPTVAAAPAEAASRLRVLCADPSHEFWSDSVSLLDDSLFRLQAITGHRQITDLYLLGLAVRHGGRLATFDRSIPFKAVVGAGPDRLELIGSVPTAS